MQKLKVVSVAEDLLASKVDAQEFAAVVARQLQIGTTQDATYFAKLLVEGYKQLAPAQ